MEKFLLKLMSGLPGKSLTMTRMMLCVVAFMGISVTGASAYDLAVPNADGVTIYYNRGNTGLTVTYKDGTTANSYSGKVVVPDSVTYEGSTMPVTGIGERAFYGCTLLTSVTIGDKVQFIGNDAFRGCANLDAVVIPNSVTSIGDEAFAECSNLESATIGNSVKSIGRDAFNSCKNLKKVVIPNSVTSLGMRAFSACSLLSSVEIGTGITTIESYTFCRTGLTSVVIPNQILSIKEGAFLECELLSSATIGNSVITMGRGAFSGCKKLASITIPNSVKTIERDAFNDCSSATSLEIGSGLKTIEIGVFSGCEKLTSVTIPDNVTVIGNGAFGGCTGLSSVAIGNGVKEIEGSAFAGCEKLTSVTIPNSVTTIGNNAFSSCTSMASAEIGENVSEMGLDTFSGCSALKTLHMKGANPPIIIARTFPQTYIEGKGWVYDITVYVPVGALTAYQNADIWKDFLYIKEDIPEAQAMFTYFQINEEKPSDVRGLGLNAQSVAGEVYNVAIYVPASFAGKRIKDISFFLRDATIVSDVKAWASSTLPSSASQADLVCLDVSQLKSCAEGRTSVDVPGNCFVPSQGCYVGYSFTINDVSSSSGKFPVAIDYGAGKAGSLYWKTSSKKTSWEDMAVAYDCNSSVGVTVSGSDFLGNAAALSSSKFDEFVALKNKGAVFSTTIANQGINPIESVTYEVKDLTTGNTVTEKTLNLSSPVKAFGEQTLSFTIPNSVAGACSYQLTLTKVNGATNESTGNVTISGTVLSVETSAKRKVLEEEFTGTWCGYCPNGIVGMERCKKQYPDSWIGIAIHGSDYLTSNDFSALLANVTSYPSAKLDRRESIYPLYVTNYMDQLLQNPSEAALQVTASWNETKDKINVTSTATFQADRSDAPYGIAYVLVGDDIDGGTDCYQSNYLSGESYSDADLQAWADKGSKVKMNYDHVGIAAKDILNGMDGSVKAPIVAGQAQQHSTTFDLTNGIKSEYGVELIQDKSKLSVVAILINRNNGHIVNAEQTTIADCSTGIEETEVNQNVTVVGIYSIDGKKLNQTRPGVNILKLSNGKVVKKVIK